jgi:hypothetical protein
MGRSLINPIASRLLTLLVPGLTKTLENELRETLAKGDPAFLAALCREGLAPLVFSQLLRQGRAVEVPPAFLSALRRIYYWSIQATVRQEQGAHRVLRALNDAGVECILLKGADLRLRVYQDPAQRPMADLDLLLNRRQVAVTQEVLGRLGYHLPPLSTDLRPGFRELFQYMLTLDPSATGGLPIDLHWELRAVAGFYRLPFADLRRRTISMDYRGVPVALLSPEHLLIHLCLNMYSDYMYSNLYGPGQIYFNSRQIVDLAMVLARLPLHWPQFLKDAAQLQCQRPLLAVLSELHKFLPDTIKPTVLSALARHRPKVAERIAFSHRLGYLTVPFVLFYHESFHCWLRYLVANLWPDPLYLAETSGCGSRIPYLKKFLGRFRPGRK